MANYKVISGRLADKQEGDLISDEELAGMNVHALIEGEHIAIVSAKQVKQDESKDK